MSDKRWRCSVCGYLHLGDAPPVCCPVCGVPPNLFEPSVALPTSAKSAPNRWRCINCDYVHDGDSPPDCCPICGVSPDQFEPASEQEQHNANQAMTGAIVIIGGGIAGLSAAEAARITSPESAITLICQEYDLPYYRLNLTRYLAGEIAASDLPVHPESWYTGQRITILNGAEVTTIDRATRTVSIRGQEVLSYEKLILAMGAHPSIPPIPGADRNNVVTLRTCRDADAILQHCRADASIVIIGGGVLGLETAAALVRRNAQVTLLEGFDWLLPRQLSQTAGERLAEEAIALGITLKCGVRIQELHGEEQVRSVLLDSGEIIPADLVIITAGVRSNSYLARMAGLDVNSGVVVDQHLRTSDPDIYAAGDLAEHQGTVYGTWAPSQFQGAIAGRNAVGAASVFAGISRSNSIKVLGVDLFSIGMIHPDDASYLTFEENGEHYQKFVFRDSRLVGAILVGDTSIAPTLKNLIENNISCSEILAGVTDAKGVRAEFGQKINH